MGDDTYGQLGVGGPRDFAAAEREKVIEVQHHEILGKASFAERGL